MGLDWDTSSESLKKYKLTYAFCLPACLFACPGTA
jgi:hypothetical protein